MGGSESKVSLGPAKRWNWGILSTQIAEDALMQPQTNPGDFLVRRSRKLNALCISTEWQSGQAFKFIEAAKGSGLSAKKFPSMQELLQFLMGGGKGGKAAFNHFGCFLLRALPKVEFAPETLNVNNLKTKKHSKKTSARRAKSDIGTIPPNFSAARRPSTSNSIGGKQNESVAGSDDTALAPKTMHGSSPRRPMSLVDEEGSTTMHVPSNATFVPSPDNSMRRRGATSFASGDRTRYVNAVMGMKGVVAMDDGQETFGFNAVDLGSRDRAGTLPGQRIIHDQQTYDQERKEKARLRRLQQLSCNSDDEVLADDVDDERRSPSHHPAGKNGYVNMVPNGAVADNNDGGVVDGPVPCRTGYVNIKLSGKGVLPGASSAPGPRAAAADTHDYEYQNAFDAPYDENAYATMREMGASQSTSPSNSDRTTAISRADDTDEKDPEDVYQYTQMVHQPSTKESDAVELPYGSFGEHIAALSTPSAVQEMTSTYIMETQLASVCTTDNVNADDGEFVTGWGIAEDDIDPGHTLLPGVRGRESAESDDSALQWYGDADPTDDDGAC